MKGEDYIGRFNSNDRKDVAEIKEKAIELIDCILALENQDGRRKAMACSHIEEAVMIAVKSIFSGK